MTGGLAGHTVAPPIVRPPGGNDAHRDPCPVRSPPRAAWLRPRGALDRGRERRRRPLRPHGRAAGGRVHHRHLRPPRLLAQRAPRRGRAHVDRVAGRRRRRAHRGAGPRPCDRVRHKRRRRHRARAGRAASRARARGDPARAGADRPRRQAGGRGLPARADRRARRDRSAPGDGGVPPRADVGHDVRGARPPSIASAASATAPTSSPGSSRRSPATFPTRSG